MAKSSFGGGRQSFQAERGSLLGEGRRVLTLATGVVRRGAARALKFTAVDGRGRQSGGAWAGVMWDWTCKTRECHFGVQIYFGSLVAYVRNNRIVLDLVSWMSVWGKAGWRISRASLNRPTGIQIQIAHMNWAIAIKYSKRLKVLGFYIPTSRGSVLLGSGL